EIRNSKAYKEYYACVTGEAAPKPKASAKKKKGDSASSTTPPTLTPITTVVSALRLSATAKEEELAKNDEEDTETGKGGDEVSESEGSEEESNDEEDQELRLSKEARIQEEEEADELYQSSSVSSFMTSMLNPTSDVGVESIFTTASSPIVSFQTPTPIMSPSTIATITTSGDAPIPPTTIPSIILENLPTFNSAFHFDERLRSLETSFSEYRQTNPFVDAVYAILGIVHQYMTQQMTEAVREAVQI
nr:hypothetical protein [Tanacetum cinerariifolium]